MKLNYPNTFDLKWANSDDRHQLGSNIFIHGKSVSIGCLAMGDPAIEEFFALIQKVGQSNAKVIITPQTREKKQLTPPANSAHWVEELDTNITLAFLAITNDNKSVSVKSQHAVL